MSLRLRPDETPKHERMVVAEGVSEFDEDYGCWMEDGWYDRAAEAAMRFLAMLKIRHYGHSKSAAKAWGRLGRSVKRGAR